MLLPIYIIEKRNTRKKTMKKTIAMAISIAILISGCSRTTNPVEENTEKQEIKVEENVSEKMADDEAETIIKNYYDAFLDIHNNIQAGKVPSLMKLIENNKEAINKVFNYKKESSNELSEYIESLKENPAVALYKELYLENKNNNDYDNRYTMNSHAIVMDKLVSAILEMDLPFDYQPQQDFLSKEGLTDSSKTSIDPNEIKKENEEASDETKCQLKELIQKYYEGYVANDIAKIEDVAFPIGNNEKKYIYISSKYEERIDVSEIYYNESTVEDGYIVFAISDIQVVGEKDVALPNFESFFIQFDENNKLFINNMYSTFNSSSWISDYRGDRAILREMEQMAHTNDMALIIAKINQDYEKVRTTNPNADKVLKDMYKDIKKMANEL